MANWKTAGWVPDSDEEESDLEPGEIIAPAPITSIAHKEPGNGASGNDGVGHAQESDEDELASLESGQLRRAYKAISQALIPRQVNEDEPKPTIHTSQDHRRSQNQQYGGQTLGTSPGAVIDNGQSFDLAQLATHQGAGKPASAPADWPEAGSKDQLEADFLLEDVGNGRNVPASTSITDNAQGQGSFSSLTSSPLSSASQSPPPPADWSIYHGPEPIGLIPQVIIPQAVIPDLRLNPEYEDELPALAPSTLAGRTFRERKAIQVHPYALEQERYRKTMHARGVRAHIIQPARSGDAHAEGEDADEEDTQPYEPPSSPPRQAPLEPDQAQNELDDLPTLEELLNQKHRKLNRPNKRRKLDHTPIDFSRTTEAPTASKTASKGFGNLPTPRHSDEQFEQVLTASTDRRRPAAVKYGPTFGFQRPRVVSRPQLHSPVTSVDPEHHDHEQASPASSPILPASTRRRRLVHRLASEDDSSQDEDSAASSSEKAESQAAALKRRIKGVLPASWSTLNLKRPPPPNKQVSERAQARTQAVGTARRIARPLSSHHNDRAKAAQDTMEIFSDDAPSSSPGPQQKDFQHRPDTLRDYIHEDTTQLWPDIDDMEDDTLDFMVQSTGTRKRSRRRRQTDEADAKRHKRVKQTTLSTHTRLQGLHGSQVRRRKPKRMSILDAQAKSSTGPTPTFIKVAVRIARTRGEKGRDSPGHKAIHLHRESDNQDIQEVFRTWNEIVSSEPAGSAEGDDSSVPLSEVSGNQLPSAQYPKSTKKQGAIQKRSTASGKTGKRPPQRRSRDTKVSKMQSALQYAATKLNIAQSTKSSREIPSLAKRALSGNLTHLIRPGMKAGPGQLSVPILDDDSHPTICANEGPFLPAAMPGSETTRRTEMSSIAPRKDDTETWRYRPRKRLQRKRPPRQTLFSAQDLQAESESDLEGIIGDDTAAGERTHPILANPPLAGLQSRAAESDFSIDIQKLPSGVLFPASSFLGSGRFSRTLRSSEPYHEEASNSAQIAASSRSLWNDTLRSSTASRFANIKTALSDRISRSACLLALQDLESIAFLLAGGVEFLDPVDRTSLLQHHLTLISETVYTLPEFESQAVSGAPKEWNRVFQCQISCRLALLAHLLVLESRLGEVQEQLQQEIVKLLTKCIQETLRHVREVGFSLLRRFSKQCCDLSLHPLENATFVTEAFVIVNLLVQENGQQCANIWQTFASIGSLRPGEIPGDPKDATVAFLEQQWRDMLSILPLTEIGAEGRIDETASRSCENWSLVKALLAPVLQAYQTGLTDRMAAFNPYCRALFRRCFTLTQTWHWERCELIIGVLFDFFARNGLANLKKEESPRGPKFLDSLASDPVLLLEHGESCFHIFLKIVGAGIRDMRRSSQNKKIKNLVWRLIPNHDRHYPKHKEPKIVDLDATKNHHDLLCTLYWSAPALHEQIRKPIQNLLQEDGSHTSAYGIHIHAWLNLVRYQISLDSTRASLAPFAAWCDVLLERLLRQHLLVRSEVEQEAATAEIEGCVVSESNKEQTIAKNTSRLETVLINILRSLETAVTSCPSVESASLLMTRTFAQVLAHFVPKSLRPSQVLIQALNVMSSAVERDRPAVSLPDPNADEDSQGFDWTGFEDLDEVEPVLPEPLFNKQVYDNLHVVLSSCFGSALCLGDELLGSLTNTWAQIASLYVKRKLKTWDSYLSAYGHDTWAVIEATEQKRRFTPRFLTLLLAEDNGVWKSQRQLILRYWLVSLTDREAELKYQGDLTAALLNLRTSDPILVGLPFFSNREGIYSISLHSLQTQRTTLLATVFSNMRKAVSREALDGSGKIAERKQEYRAMLEDMMRAMKTRFQQLGSEHEFQGSYVQFIHAILKSMQEHVLEICSLDSFFTDSAAFPLPAYDPTFLASKLKSYGVRIADSRVQKQMAPFLSAVIERSVYDGTVEAFIEQMTPSAADIQDRDAWTGLAKHVMQSALPAFLHVASATTCGWLFAVPVLAAASSLLPSIASTLDGCSKTATAAVSDDLGTLLSRIRKHLNLDNIFTAPVTVPMAMLLNASFNFLAISIPMLDYLFELRRGSSEVLNCISDFAIAQEQVHALIESAEFAFETQPVCAQAQVPPLGSGMQKYIQQDLERGALSRCRQERDRFLISRSGNWKVVFDGSNHGALQRQLLMSAKKFRRALVESTAFDHLV